jgi:ppGpp synthetase/RelA/SpoT-type nucleotidyltranferase
MNESDIINRWKSDQPIYSAWADFILNEINSRLLALINPTPLDYFLKVPVKPRLKAESTLVDKALFRNKDYQNPYADITDKVGMRYVVLLTSDIKKLCAIIEGSDCCHFWDPSKDRDYEEERLIKPLEFSYQSVHYVLRAKQEIERLGVKIPIGTACELQIRTLLQHAHSELTHDTLYKPKTNAQPHVKRTVAKSMALIEATDEFFEQAMQNLNEAAKGQRELLEQLTLLYFLNIGEQPGSERSNQLLIDTFWKNLPANINEEISSYLNSKDFIYDRIKGRLELLHIFKQPVILLAYYMVDKMAETTKQYWPTDRGDLELVFSDLGKSID